VSIGGLRATTPHWLLKRAISRWWSLSLSALLLATALSRLPNVTSNIRYIDYWDEFQVFWNSMFMVREGRLTTEFFFYGHFAFYLALATSAPILLILHRTGALQTLNEVVPRPDYEFSLGYSELLVAQRALWLGLSLVLIVITARIGAQLSDKVTGFIAAVILAVNPLAVLVGTRLVVDGVAATLAGGAWLIALGTLSNASTNESISRLRTAAIVAGLAAATKYNYGVVALAPVCALFVRRGLDLDIRDRARLTIGLGIRSVGAFGLAMPSAFLFPHTFINHLRFQSHWYRTATGFSEPGIAQLMTQIKSLQSNFGLPTLALLVVGIGSTALRRDAWRPALVLLLPVLPFGFVMLNARVDFHRHWMLFYPVFAVMSATGLTSLARLLVRSTASTAFRNCTAAHKLGGAIAVLAAITINWTGVSNLAPTENPFSQFDTAQDTRSSAMASVFATACPAGSNVFVDELLLVNGPDLRPPCNGSNVTVMRRSDAIRTAEPNDVIVLCGDTLIAREVLLEVANFEGSDCLTSLVPLWSNPPRNNPSVSVFSKR